MFSVKKFLQANLKNFTVGSNTSRIKYLVIHYVGALGGGEANLKYYANNVVGASAHYYVDFNGDIYQSVHDKDIAWHCGTKNGYRHPECRNQNSISIEMCVRNKGSMNADSKDWYFEGETVASTIELAKFIMAKYNIPLDRVIRHYDVTGKICPNPYVFNHTNYTWEAFKQSLVSISTPTKKSGWQKEDNNTVWRFYNGDTGLCVRNDWHHDLENDKWYWFDGNGAMITDKWYEYNNEWYYLGPDGAMLKGQQTINGEWFYFLEDGEMSSEPVILKPADNGALKFAGLAQ